MAESAASIGTRLRQIREKRGLSQNALAVRVGLHPSQVSRIERGVNEPTVRTLRALAGALRVKLDTLAG